MQAETAKQDVAKSMKLSGRLAMALGLLFIAYHISSYVYMLSLFSNAAFKANLMGALLGLAFIIDAISIFHVLYTVFYVRKPRTSIAKRLLKNLLIQVFWEIGAFLTAFMLVVTGDSDDLHTGIYMPLPSIFSWGMPIAAAAAIDLVLIVPYAWYFFNFVSCLKELEFYTLQEQYVPLPTFVHSSTKEDYSIDISNPETLIAKDQKTAELPYSKEAAYTNTNQSQLNDKLV